jgi:hypothetical protein
MKFATTGLDNPNGDYLIAGECDKCGAGREMRLPLHIPVNQMRKKRIDQNQRYGYVIADVKLVEEIGLHGLTGIQDHSVQVGVMKKEFRHIVVSNTLPRMAPESKINKVDVCPKCYRSGHYDNYARETRFIYNRLKDDSWCDFNLTWEYFGIWDMGQNIQSLVVSKRAYEFIRNLRLRHIKFEPIDIFS